MEHKLSKKFHTIPELAKQVKQYKKDVFLTWSIVFVESALEILIAFFIQFLMAAIGKNDMGGIL